MSRSRSSPRNASPSFSGPGATKGGLAARGAIEYGKSHFP
jgi:hypothetical protein